MRSAPFWLGIVVLAGLTASLCASVLLGRPGSGKIPSYALESFTVLVAERGLLFFAIFVYVLTVLVRSFRGELPTGLKTDGAEYSTAQAIGAKAEDEIVKLTKRLDDQAAFIESELRRLHRLHAETTDRLSAIEGATGRRRRRL